MELPTAEATTTRRMSMIADDAEVSLTFNRDHETLTVEVTKGNFTLDGFNLRLWGYFVSEAWSETTQKKRKR